MSDKASERRTNIRFFIDGVTLQYKKKVTNPLMNISRGGISFLTREPLKLDKRLRLRLSLPYEDLPWSLKGRVRWCLPDPAQWNEYQIGVHFLPFGLRRGANNLRVLEEIIKLEHRKSLEC